MPSCWAIWKQHREQFQKRQPGLTLKPKGQQATAPGQPEVELETTVSELEISATHRNGQTFLVWDEVSDSQYHVYRHNEPITASNLGDATHLTSRWGPLDQNTSVNQFGHEGVPANFVISDLEPPLTDDQGLFVHTTQPDQQGNAFYAVTTIDEDGENTSVVGGVNSTTETLVESVGTPRPVLSASFNGGNGRVYTQYMDYANWNPTLSGYAFNFALGFPANYDPSTSYPLMLELHAFGTDHKVIDQTEYEWPTFQLLPSDPGPKSSTVHTWWYGFSADHNYQTNDGPPTTGTIENFTEQRVIAAVNYVASDPEFNVDQERVHAFGNSMGASGVLSLGIRYPSVFAGIYASQPMTNYPASPMFQPNFVRLWGEQQRNLPIVNAGPNSSELVRYGAGQAQATGVWDWMNHQEQLVRRKADRFAYLMVDHGKADNTIDWETQGEPMAQVFTDAKVGFSATQAAGAGHSWMAFDSIVNPVFGLGYGDESAWRYPHTLSFPGIHNASGSGDLRPGLNQDDHHNTTIEWATPTNDFHQSIVDEPGRWEISLRSQTATQTADITPRNTNKFTPQPGTQCQWLATRIDDDGEVASGATKVDESGLLTSQGVPISEQGNRLSITCG